MNFIDSCQSLVSGREGWREQAAGGREKKNDGGMQEIVRLMYTEVVRMYVMCFSFFLPFFCFFLPFLPFFSFSFSFLRDERNKFSIDLIGR